MSRKKVSTTVYLTAEQALSLRALTERTKVPVAEYIRQAIDKLLDEKRAKGELKDADNIVQFAPIGTRTTVREESIEAAIERTLRRMLIGNTEAK